MPIFKYQITLDREEEVVEEGIVVAKDEADAKAKLKSLRYRQIRLKRLKGWTAFLGGFNADVR